MAANGGRHFEINIKIKNLWNNLFLKNMHTQKLLTIAVFVQYVNNHSVGLFYKYCT